MRGENFVEMKMITRKKKKGKIKAGEVKKMRGNNVMDEK